MATKKVNIDIVAKDKSQRALKGVQGSLDGVKKAVFNVRNAFLGLGAGLVIRNLVNTGKELENLQVRLKFLLKDTNEGAKAFDNMVKFASKVPFSLEEIQAGSGILATVTDNADDLQNMLEITGNVAAVTGLDFRTASEQIQRSFSAGIGAADLFREKGVRNMLGFKAGATVSIEETVQAFEDVFGSNGRFGSSTDELAQTLEGTLSMINDKVFLFKKTLLDAGFFAELKSQFGDLNKFLEQNEETLQDIAESIGRGLAKTVVAFAESVKILADNFHLLKGAVAGFVAFKLAVLIPKITKAIGLLRIQTVGLVALTGPKGLALIGASFVAMEVAARDFKKEVNEVEEQLKKLTLSELANRAIKVKAEMSKLAIESENLVGSFEKQNEALKENNVHFPEIQLNMGETAVLIADTSRESTELTSKFHALSEELKLLEMLLKQGGDGTKKLIEPLGLLDNDILPGFTDAVGDANAELEKLDNKIKPLIENVGSLDGDFRNLHPTLLSTVEANKSLIDSFNGVNDAMNNARVSTGPTRPDQQVGMSEADKEALKEKQAHADEVTKILEKNILEGKLLHIERALFEEELYNKQKIQEINDEIAHFQHMKQIHKEYAESRIAGEKALEDQKAQIRKDAQDHAIKESRDALEILSGMNKTAFKVFKAVRIAEATVNTYTAAAEAFKRFGGFPFGAMAAAATVAKGLALVAQIKSTSFREKGGPVQQGRPFIVGEKGPEMFVPNQSGNIVPNNKMGMGGPVNVNFTINAIDTRGFRSLLNNEKGTIVNIINQAVTDKGRPVLV